MADANDLINPLEEEEVLTPPTEELEPEELEEVEEPNEEVEAVEEPEDEPEERPISRREQLRIQDLLSRERSEDPKPKAREDRIDYRKEFSVEDDDAQRLERDRSASEEYYYQQGLEQAKSLKFHTRLEVDAPLVAQRYGILDKNNEEQFHPAVANSLNQFYLSMVGFDKKTDTVQNPELRYSEFTDAIFELAEEIANTKTATSTRAVKDQAAKTGLRPDGSAAKKLDLNKAPQDMTDEELEAYIKANLG